MSDDREKYSEGEAEKYSEGDAEKYSEGDVEGHVVHPVVHPRAAEGETTDEGDDVEGHVIHPKTSEG